MDKPFEATPVPAWVSRWMVPSADPGDISSFVGRVVATDMATESVMYAPFPYGPDELLVVLPDDAVSVPEIYGKLSAFAPSSVRLTCLRKRELFELGIGGYVAPSMTATYGVSAFWLRYGSSLMQGTDSRDLIPVRAWTQQEAKLTGLLAVYFRHHVTHANLVRHGANRLATAVSRAIGLMMLSALFVVHPRCVTPSELETLFAHTYPVVAPHAEELAAALEGEPLDDENCYHISFLYDRFLRVYGRQFR
jgi:hypothetical protein